MHLTLGERKFRSGQTDSPTAGHKAGILNTSCESVHLYLFAYSLTKEIHFHLSLCVT
jgi:hypothetical protein